MRMHALCGFPRSSELRLLRDSVRRTHFLFVRSHEPLQMRSVDLSTLALSTLSGRRSRRWLLFQAEKRGAWAPSLTRCQVRRRAISPPAAT